MRLTPLRGENIVASQIEYRSPSYQLKAVRPVEQNVSATHAKVFQHLIGDVGKLEQASTDDFFKEAFLGDRYAKYAESVVPSLQEGAIMFHYAVTESTNFLGWNFPLKFEFFQKGREHVQNGNWFYRGIGRVKSIRPAAKPKGLFVPSMQQTIVDWRFREPTAKVNGIIYTSTNAFAAPTNDPVLKEKFITRVERAPPQPAFNRASP